MSETKSDRREKIRERIEKRQKKDDLEYLNSKTRVAKGLVFAIIEYIIVFVLISLAMDYVTYGSISVDTLPDTIRTYLKPGGVILTALVAYLPLLVISNIGLYFGLGTVGRMAFGIIKIVGLIIFLHLLVNQAGTIDLVEVAGMSGSMSGVGLESFTINLEPIVKLLDIILVICLIIPVFEFLGARRKHNEAVLRQEDREKAEEKKKETDSKQEDKAAEKKETESKQDNIEEAEEKEKAESESKQEDKAEEEEKKSEA